MKKYWNKLALLLCLLAGFGLAFTGCSSGDDDDGGSSNQTSDPNSGSESVTDSGVIEVTAPSTAGAVVLVADSDTSTKLYEGTSVQEALAYLMTNSLSDSYTISVAAGTYNEMLFYTGSASITIEGTGTAEYGTDVLITYSNSGNTNSMQSLCNTYSITNGYFRGATRFNGTCNLVLKNVTIQNSYSRGSATSNTQAEALVFSSTGNMIAYNSTFLSHQDTLYLGQQGGRMWFYKSYISGDVDFIWGYPDVALFEECSIYCRGDETTKSYIFASRSVVDTEANKGIVLLNNDIEIASGVTGWYGRNSGADTQAAILNSTITGAGTLNSNLYQSAPGEYVEDAAGDLAIGYKDYNNTMNGTLVDTSNRLTLCGELSERVAKREYNGRYVILNRGYDETAEQYETASTIWDISEYEEEFNATEDTSADNVYVDPVYAKNIVGGNTVQLTPSSDVENLTYTYASSDENLATVDANGLVTTIAGADGTATITMTASNGNTDTMGVKVIPEDISAESLSVSLADSSVAKYGITTATITFEPADTTNQTFTLVSSDSSVKFYEAGSGLVTSTTVEAEDGSAEVYVWVSGEATLTATSTAYTSASAGTATTSVTENEVTWLAQPGSYRMGTDIQSGKAGLWDGLVIDSAADGTIITANGKMSFKSYPKMQTRNVHLYIPVEGASTVTLNLAAGADTSACYYTVGDSTTNDFTANDDNTVYTYTYDGSATGIVLGSSLSGLTFYKTAGDDIDANTKYLKVNVVKSGSDVYLTSIDVKKTGDFTATWEETEEVEGADGTYTFGSSDYVDDSNNYTSSDTYVTGTGLTADGKGHGYAVVAGSTVTIQAAGIAQIDVLGCQYGGGAAFTAAVGSTTLATFSTTKVSTCGSVGATFFYTTDAAADIVITFTGAGWVHGIVVTNLDSFTPVTAISVSGDDEVTATETITLTASATPSDATYTAVDWSSSDTSVATVSSAGVVTGVAAGTVTITATAKDGSGVIGTKEITVNAASFDPSNATVTWDVASSSVNIQKILGNIKASVSGSTDYEVRAIVDASCSSGKLQGNGTHAQMNSGTVMSVPMTAGAVLTVTAVDGGQYALYTIAGTAADTSSTTSTYTATEAGWVDIVSTGTAYPSCVEITGLDVDNLPSAISKDFGWNEAQIVADAMSFNGTTGYYAELYVDASSGKFAANNTSWTQINAGTIIYVPMSGDGAVTFEVYGAMTITGGSSTDLSTTAAATVTYNYTTTDAVTISEVTYAKITIGTSSYIKNLARKY